MLYLTHVVVSALVVGNGGLTARSTVGSARSGDVTMMPKFLKEIFPNLEKPENVGQSISDAFASLLPSLAPLPEIDVKEPDSAIVAAASKVMPALSPVFSAEADLQATVTNFGSYDEEEVRAEIESTIRAAPVVVYTYGLSPFSSEALAVLESTGCEVDNVELGAEWFALGGGGSATRVELRKMFGQGSLPHIFIGGEWVGGLATGADGGLAGLVERGELVGKLRKAKAL